jgi:hypothetical protein
VIDPAYIQSTINAPLIPEGVCPSPSTHLGRERNTEQARERNGGEEEENGEREGQINTMFSFKIFYEKIVDFLLY